MWIRGRRGYLSNLKLFNVNFIDWGLSSIKHLPFEYNFLNLKNSDTMIYRWSGCNQVCQNSTKAGHSAIWRKSRFTKQFPIFPKFLLIDKIIPTQPSVYSTHSSGLWCHSYTVAKPCRSPAIGRLATQARENTSSWARHSPKLSPAGPCVYAKCPEFRNFVPPPSFPSICLCQCIVWDPLASRKLMLALEMKSEKQLYRLILFTVELVCSRWRKMENAPLYFVVTHSQCASI